MRLMLLRHGKPESESPTGRDFDCPLAKEGFRQAQFIAAQLGEGRKLAGSTPVAVLSSPAARARATAKVIALRAACPAYFLRARLIPIRRLPQTAFWRPTS